MSSREVLAELWKLDPIEMPTHEIARRLGVSQSRVHQLRRTMKLPARRRRAPNAGACCVDREEFARLWNMPPLEMPASEIATRLGISASTISLLRARFGLPERKRVCKWNGKPGLGGRERRVVDTAKLFKLWHMPPAEMPPMRICRELGISQSLLYTLKKRHHLPERGRAPSVDTDPTDAEIIERAAEVRASWPEGEAERRMVGIMRKRWTPPAYAYDGRDIKFAGVSVDR